MRKNLRTFQKWPILILASTTIVACGSSSSNDNEELDITAPSVLQVSPANETLNVESSSHIQVVFNEDMLLTSFDDNTFSLQSEGKNVALYMAFDEQSRQATFTPLSALGPLRTYDASLNNTVTDLSGNPLASDLTWSFTTQEAEWQSPLALSTLESGYLSFHHQLAENSLGQKAAVWAIYSPATESTEEVRELHTSTYQKDTGWAEVVTLNHQGDSVSDPQIIAINDTEFLTVWEQENNDQYNLYSSHFTIDTGWSEPKLLAQFETGNSYDPNLYMNQDGQATVIWLLDEGSHEPHHIYTTSYQSQNASWSDAEVIEEHTDNISGLEFSQDQLGNILLAWYQIDDNAWNIHSKRFDVDSEMGWLDSQLVANALRPTLAMNNHGQAVIGWYDYLDQDSDHNVIRVSHYDVSNDSWGSAQLVSSENENTNVAGSPYLAVSDEGSVIVAWRQKIDDAKNDIWSRSYKDGTWNTAQQIDNSGEEDVSLNSLVIDDLGNAMTAWSFSVDGGASNIYTARLNSQGWQTPTALNDNTQQGEDAAQTYLYVNNFGRISAMWRHSSQTWFAEFK